MARPQPNEAAIPPPTAASQAKLIETQAFTRARILFAVLLAVVLGLLWLLQSRYS